MLTGKKKSVAHPFTRHNIVKLVHGGRDYFNCLLQIIGNAKHSIHLFVYIFEADETGESIANALMEASGKGVKVFLLVDGYASQDLPPDFIRKLEMAGIHFRWFEPLLRSRHFYFGRRLHCKIALVDGAVSLVGGINISDRYNDMPGKSGWLDWALYTEGEANKNLFSICQDLWDKSWFGKQTSHGSHEMPLPIIPVEACLVRMRRNDWIQGKNEITRSYVKMIRESRSHIFIMSSYFIPGRIIKKNLSRAAKRGVEIIIITAGKSDILLAKNAERHIYLWLLANNIKIYEYQSNILHGKLSACDGKWATVGSYNINNISAYASIEINMEVINKPFVKQVENTLRQIILKDCVCITEEVFKRHNTFLKRIWQRICYDIFRLLFYLFTFYFKQNR